MYDTANLFHAWYSELPKDLSSLNSFFVRKSMYWKDLAETTDLHEYYRYNAIDTWATGICCIAMMLEMPRYAFNNYLLEFPVVFPCILSEMTGIKRDMSMLEEVQKSKQAEDDKEIASLRKMLGEPTFNPGSPKQVGQLLQLLGCKDITSCETDKSSRYESRTK